MVDTTASEKKQAPSNEMVERVARALCREDASVVPMSLGDMHLHVNNCWGYFVRQARAAIVADIWRDMIDEALR